MKLANKKTLIQAIAGIILLGALVLLSEECKAQVVAIDFIYNEIDSTYQEVERTTYNDSTYIEIGKTPIKYTEWEEHLEAITKQDSLFLEIDLARAKQDSINLEKRKKEAEKEAQKKAEGKVFKFLSGGNWELSSEGVNEILNFKKGALKNKKNSFIVTVKTKNKFFIVFSGEKLIFRINDKNIDSATDSNGERYTLTRVER